jgi:multicomponent Na+:H+ antiporter subunit B
LKWLSMLIMVLFLGLMLYATSGLPDHADPEAPANVHVSPTYIEDSVEDTHTPNVVTAVLADYRGYDTLGETVVIFTAGLACVLALMKRKSNDKKTLSKHHSSDHL